MAKLKVSAPFNYREGAQTFHYPTGDYEVTERCSEKTVSAAAAAHAVKIKVAVLPEEKSPAKAPAKPNTPAE
ncbi:hypothetical protein [Pseudomonas sp. ML96]|uniref:hypothetical protein n=1 Tax=Pseudomonas sp. ML96 TaxID=1523503 RepID=UPI0005BE24C3|nr:hypothetical protein [Pseudomonas sp. ML96]